MSSGQFSLPGILISSRSHEKEYTNNRIRNEPDPITMTREQPAGPKAAAHDRHLHRHGYWNERPLKKSGGGKFNWGRPGDEAADEDIPVHEAFDDKEYREEEAYRNVHERKLSLVESPEELAALKAAFVSI
jgi:hypothetical protein